jgi:hypothetical protein
VENSLGKDPKRKSPYLTQLKKGLSWVAIKPLEASDRENIFTARTLSS